jgi:outer membrane receptor for ferrienterochelin and colicins
LPEWQINDEWRLELNAFHTWLDDTLVVEPRDNPATPGVIENVRTNGDSSTIYGAELNLGYFRDTWRLELSWVEQRLEYENPQLVLGDPALADPADNPVFSGTYLRTPESLGLLRYTHEGPWFDTFVTAKLTGPTDVPHIVSDPTTGALVGNRVQRSPWFFNVDVGISREFEVPGGDLTASLGVKNLLDDFQSDLDRGTFRDASYVYGPAFPRTVYAGVRYEF